MFVFVLGVYGLINQPVKPCDTVFAGIKENRKIISVTCYSNKPDGKTVATTEWPGNSFTNICEGFLDSNLNFIKHGIMFTLDTFSGKKNIDTSFICNFNKGKVDGQQRIYGTDSGGLRFLLQSSHWCNGNPCGVWRSFYPNLQHSVYLTIKWHHKYDKHSTSLQGNSIFYYKNKKIKAKGKFALFSASLPTCLANKFCILPPESNNWVCEKPLSPIGNWHFYDNEEKRIDVIIFSTKFENYFNYKIDCTKVNIGSEK